MINNISIITPANQPSPQKTLTNHSPTLMLSWSLTFSPILTNNSKLADKLHHKLLTTPINPRLEIQLNYQTLAERIYASLGLADITTSIKDVRRFLAKPDSSTLSKHINNYHTTLDYIRYDWTNNPNPITNSTLFALHKHFSRNIKHKSGLRDKNLTIKDGAANQSFTTPSPEEIPFQLDSLMSEVNQPDRQHPLVIAGIAHIQILRILPFKEFNQIAALLFSELILTKHNFTKHFLVNPEAIFLQSETSYLEAARSALSREANLNDWLIYFTTAFTNAQENALSRLQNTSFQKPAETLKLARLNRRQLAILRYLDNPHHIINNTEVVKRFKVSQITASRDLSKLKNLHLITQVGRGRSTTYTKL